MKNALRGIALLLFALVLAIVGQTADEILYVISLIAATTGLAVAFWDGIAAFWHRWTAESTNEKDKS